MLIDPKNICWDKKEAFKVELSKRPYEIRGLYPSSFDRKTRTDIVIALIKEGFLKYEDRSWGAALTILRPFILQGHLYHSDRLEAKKTGLPIGHTTSSNKVEFSYVDWDRIERMFDKNLFSG